VSDVVVYHNPKCSQSRTALGLLRERGLDVEVVEYLTRPLARHDFERILDLLDVSPAELVRKDKRFTELGLRADDYVDRDSVIDVLLLHPELMQRPIVIRSGRAIVARPGERVLEIS
jgi:arsenate reductase